MPACPDPPDASPASPASPAFAPSNAARADAVPPGEADDLRRQLVGALKSRAMLVAALHEALVPEVGEARATEVLARVLRARGTEAGRRVLAGCAPADFRGLLERFTDFLPDHGRLFEIDVERCDEAGLTLRFLTCPLKAAWIEAGLPDARVQTLCAISGALDVGTFEGAGFAVENHTWRAGRDGCCHLHVRRRD